MGERENKLEGMAPLCPYLSPGHRFLEKLMASKAAGGASAAIGGASGLSPMALAKVSERPI
jgi:hypothetical protein